MDTTPAPIAYDIPHAARQLGIGRSLVYELLNAGKLRAIKINTRTVITAAELRRFIAEAESKSPMVPK